jgi:DnaJ-class molecular chaperone
MTTETKDKDLTICRACDGDGYIPDLEKPKGTWYESKKCPYCDGEGWILKTSLPLLKK